MDEDNPAGSTVAENLTYLTGTRGVTLGHCKALGEWVLARLNIRHSASPIDYESVLRRVLAAVAGQVRARVGARFQGGLITNRSDDTDFQAAAAGELLGVGANDEAFVRIREDYCKGKGRLWEDLARDPDNKGKSRLRAMRAGFWIDQDGRTARNHRRKLLIAFEAAIDRYLSQICDSERRSLQELLVSVNAVADGEVADHSETVDSARKANLGNLAYIRRDSYHTRFSELIASGTKCIVLTGLPGIGKTQLAEALVGEQLIDAAAPVVIRISDGRINPQDMQYALSIIGLRADPTAVWSSPEAYLAELLCGTSAPKFVIFDNLDRFGDIDRILPRETTSTLIVTCRAMTNTMRAHRTIPVGWMERSEAARLVTSYLPTISDSDARLLVKTLSGYPILIRSACALYAYQPTPMQRFCEVLESEVVILAGRAEYTDAGEHKMLLVLLERLVMLARQESELAFDLLACAAHINSSPDIDIPFIRDCLLALNKTRPAEIAWYHALEVLRRLALIETWRESTTIFDQEGEGTTYDIDRLSMHSLIQRLMQHLLASSKTRVAQAATEVLRSTSDALQQAIRIYELDQYYAETDEFLAPEAGVVETAAYCYEAVRMIRTYRGTLQMQADTIRIIDTRKQSPGMCMGAILFSFYSPELPWRLFDLELESRPAAGVEVELLGYRFNLIESELIRRYAMEVRTLIHRGPLPARMTRTPWPDLEPQRSYQFHGVGTLITDVVPWFEEPMTDSEKAIVRASKSIVMYIGDLNEELRESMLSYVRRGLVGRRAKPTSEASG